MPKDEELEQLRRLKGENACYVKSVEEEKLRNKMDYVTIAVL